MAFPAPILAALVALLADVDSLVHRMKGHVRAPSHRVFYVRASGSDTASGRSPGRAWRTVNRVNRARLRPGDRVVFAGSGTFAGALQPARSGRPGAPVVYRSYGRGRATLTGGVYLRSVRWIRLERLRVTAATAGVASGATGSGAQHVTIRRCVITEVGIGVNAGNPRDARWLITQTRVARTGDSGIIFAGSNVRVLANRIVYTGLDDRIGYGRHGVYAKGPDALVSGNVIDHFHTEGVSTRYHGAVIMGNRIGHGDGGVGYYRDDPRIGWTRISGNRIAQVRYGIYISPRDAAGPTRDMFEIARNVISAPPGRALSVAPGVRVLLTDNVLTAP